MQWCPVDICTRGAWGTFLVASKADLPRLRKDVSHDIPAVTTLMLDMDQSFQFWIADLQSLVKTHDPSTPAWLVSQAFLCAETMHDELHVILVSWNYERKWIPFKWPFLDIFSGHMASRHVGGAHMIVSHPGGLSHRDTRWETARSSRCTGILGELCWRCSFGMLQTLLVFDVRLMLKINVILPILREIWHAKDSTQGPAARVNVGELVAFFFANILREIREDIWLYDCVYFRKATHHTPLLFRPFFHFNLLVV